MTFLNRLKGEIFVHGIPKLGFIAQVQLLLSANSLFGVIVLSNQV